MTELIEKVSSPIYCGAWLDSYTFVVGGGGGTSRSGISNFLNVYKLNKQERRLELVQEVKLSGEEDAPMSCSYNTKDNLLACGINSSANDIKENNNQSCRIYQFENNELSLKEKVKILISNSKSEYQKATQFSPSGKLLLVGSAEGQVSILNTTNFKPKINSKRCNDEIIDDGDFNSEETLFASSSDKVIHFWQLEDGEMIDSIEPPIYKKTSRCQYRAIRFGKGENTDFLYAAINSRRKDHSYISKFLIEGVELVRTQSTGLKPITALDISHNGKYLAIVLSDFTVKVLDAKTLKIHATYKNLHTFPITTLKFSPNDDFLLTGSTDASLRLTPIPEEFPTGFQNMLLILLAILTLIAAILLQLYPIDQWKF